MSISYLNFLKKTVLLLAFGLLSIAATAQKSVSGIVTDAKNEALIGVTVSLKGTARGAITDLDGKFSIAVTELPVVVRANYAGYR
jgi:TonB-dependent starch-binding outer membrane protein SusC